jgi:hypothetical protein
VSCGCLGAAAAGRSGNAGRSGKPGAKGGAGVESNGAAGWAVVGVLVAGRGRRPRTAGGELWPSCGLMLPGGLE